MKTLIFPRALLFRRWVTAAPPWRHRRRNRRATSQVVRKARSQKENVDDLIPYLPSEIVLNILSRLPVRTVMNCKRVCKAWRDLLDTREFVQSHFSKSVPGLAVYLSGGKSKPYRIVEFVDEHRLNTVFSFDLPFISGYNIVHSSANGLLYVCKRYWNSSEQSFVCNPITREYIRTPSPDLEASSRHAINYGFGVSKMSGQYKVVWFSLGAADCQVYTVGTGSWRRVASYDNLEYNEGSVGVFLNGNLHWLACECSCDLICCLDLETECFSTFSPPPPCGCGDYDYRTLSVLGDYLCVCDTSVEHGVAYIDIWLMKEYGDDKSWTDDEIQILTPWEFSDGDHCPIKVFKDGDLLMDWGSQQLLYYSSKSETIQEVMHGFSFTYTPSFLPLKTFAMENVSSF